MRQVRVIAMVLLAATVVSGCASMRPRHEVMTYTLDLARGPGAAADASTIVLHIGRFDVSRRYEGESLVYRTGEFEYEADYYNRFLTPPGTMIREQVKKWLSRSPIVADVADRRSGSRADYTLEGEVIELYGDFRDKAAPAAVVEMQMMLLKEGEPRTEIVFQETYSQKVPLEQTSVRMLLAGFKEALLAIMADFEADLAAIG